MVEPRSPTKSVKVQSQIDEAYEIFMKKYLNANIRLIYEFEAIIGQGSFGTVRKGCLKKKKGVKFAIKTIAKESIKKVSDIE